MSKQYPHDDLRQAMSTAPTRKGMTREEAGNRFDIDFAWGFLMWCAKWGLGLLGLVTAINWMVTGQL